MSSREKMMKRTSKCKKEKKHQEDEYQQMGRGECIAI
jgi:hypothetical protein